jgi:DHA2 family multidrug resistance protein
MLGVCLYGTVFVLPVYLQQLQGFTANQTGMVILPGALASALVMAVSGRLAGASRRAASASPGVAIFVFAMWQMSHYTTLSGQRDFFWPMIARGAGSG